MRDTIYDQVTTPEQLENYVRGVKIGNYTSLVVVGRGGTGKSTVVRKHFPENDPEDTKPADENQGAYWKKGRITPVKLYTHLYNFRDRNIVIDDAPNLGKNLTLAGLLRQLFETEDDRMVSWDTQNPNIGGEFGPPHSFRTKSKLILITNRWMERHEEVEALETRTPIVLYNPSLELIHSQAVAGVRAKLKDSSGHARFEPIVVKYLGERLAAGQVHALNLRDYINAGRRLRNGDNWKAVLDQQILPDVIEHVPSDVEFVEGWMLRHHVTSITSASLYRQTKRFRGDQSALIEVLEWMVKNGKLVKKAARAAHGPGRKPLPEYIVPPFKIAEEKPKVRGRSIRSKKLMVS